MNTFREIVDAWPSRKLLAEDISVSPSAITNMVARNSIPARHWQSLIEAANRRQIKGITSEVLTMIVALEDAE